MKNMKKHFLASGVLAGALGFAQPAEAAYWIVIDNYGTNGEPSWAGTTGTITVKTKINGTWATICDLGANGLYEALWCFDGRGFEWDDVQAIEIRTNSSNGFWLDQLHLYEYIDEWDVELQWTSGSDNNTGWCFSSGAEDPSQYCIDGWWLARQWTTT